MTDSEEQRGSERASNRKRRNRMRIDILWYIDISSSHDRSRGVFSLIIILYEYFILVLVILKFLLKCPIINNNRF